MITKSAMATAVGKNRNFSIKKPPLPEAFRTLPTRSAMASEFIGKFKFTSQENFDQILAAYGMEMALRKAVESSEPILEIGAERDQWTMKTWDDNLGHWSITFQMDQEFEHDTPDGRHVKSSVTIKSNKMVWKEEWNDMTITHIMEVDDDELTMTILNDIIRCVRKFKRI